MTCLVLFRYTEEQMRTRCTSMDLWQGREGHHKLGLHGLCLCPVTYSASVARTRIGEFMLSWASLYLYFTSWHKATQGRVIPWSVNLSVTGFWGLIIDGKLGAPPSPPSTKYLHASEPTSTHELRQVRDLYLEYHKVFGYNLWGDRVERARSCYSLCLCEY